ncbi:MAG: M23 family metallopeptidase [Nocardioidaceae bacterium]|nr:M23 family metallopeptidase [Nocardioidaceae bacterium]MCL2615161.1 M23 family metallopeptidase [Nocardioidaceae bacterium]
MNIRTSLRRAVVAPSLIGLAIAAAAVTTDDAGTPSTDLRLAAAPTVPRPVEIHRRALHPLPMVLPVRHYVLTAGFGEVSGLWHTFHTGLDFAAPIGTPIHAIGEGTVVSTGYEGDYGNRTVVRLDGGTVLWFCHQSAFEVHPGEHVEPGQVIGLVGDTGNTTGPHLHLEVHPHGGPAVDPKPWLISQGLKP